MAEKEKYVAYVGTYTHGSSIGIHIYDLDVRKGTMTERDVVPVNNASYMTKSYNGKYLYSITDEGVEVLKILPDGGLSPINTVGIDGMRGCYLSTDKSGRFLYVGGYHDGKVTVVHTHKDGRLGSVMDGVFHKSLGIGTSANRNYQPHVTCVIPSPYDKYLCAVDNGIDQVRFYHVDDKKGELEYVDSLRCKLGSGPRRMIFSKDGRFAYINCELINEICVYSYDPGDKAPSFELIQEINCLRDTESIGAATCSMKLSPSGKYLYTSISGENTVAVYSVNQKTGMLTLLFCLPISGDYPKDIDVFPGEKTLVVLNHDSNEMTFFKLDYKNKTMMMKGRPIEIETPNYILIDKVGESEEE